MKFATPQVPTFSATGDIPRGALDEVFALLHKVGLEVDGRQPEGAADQSLLETERLVARIAEQLRALKEQRARLAELIDSIDYAGV